MARSRISPLSGAIVLVLLALGSSYAIYAMAHENDEVSTPAGLKVENRTVSNQSDRATPYFNDQYGFGFTVPDGWTTKESKPSTGDIYLTVTLTDPASKERLMFSVMSPSQESLVRDSLSVITEKPVLIDSVEGIMLSGEDLKDGSAVTILLVKRGQYLYEVTSYASSGTLDLFASTINITK